MLSNVRWSFIALPVVLIGLLEVASDSVLDRILPAPFDVLVIPTAVLLLSLGFGRIAFRRIDRLSDTLRERNLTLERRNASLQALRRLGLKLTTFVASDEILQAVTADARVLLEADAAFTTRSAPDGSEQISSLDGGQPIGTPRLAAPMQRGPVTIGSLGVGPRSDGRRYGPEDLEMLSSLAAQAAVALDNIRLQRELRELAIKGERERIAREMHDGLAQVLGYVNTKAQAVEELLSVGSTQRARQQLAELSAAARSVYVDVRESILGLSSPIVPERGLVGALEEYAARFSEASTLVTEVDASPEARAIRLSPEIQAQVFRIVQEGLTNVRKHASAGRARVDLDTRDHELVLLVEDDGLGFDPQAADPPDWPRYGMRAIRERAAAVGGSVSWSSGPGAGTVLRLRVPIGQPAGVAG
ncbi:MAG TPA: GAF domain-containing sensor histidine kinase [Candidatus Limnocylindria bacterium]